MGAPIPPFASFGKGTVATLHGSERVIPIKPAFNPPGQGVITRTCEYCASSVTSPRCESCGAPVRKQRKADIPPRPLPPPMRQSGGPPENIKVGGWPGLSFPNTLWIAIGVVLGLLSMLTWSGA
jgi:hypothetical protein